MSEITTTTDNKADSPMNETGKLGVALSGGGARGIAHIGVLKILEENEIKIDYLAGTSMGGVIAAGYAAGMSPGEIEQIAQKFRHTRDLLKLADLGLPGSGIFQGEQLLKFFKEYIGDITFDDLKVPLGLVAVDIIRGEEVHIFEGSVPEALRATSSVPGVFAPLEKGDQRLVDGGLLNNLPVDVVYKMGAKVVLAVDVTKNIDGTIWQNLQEARYLPGSIREAISVVGTSADILIRQQRRYKIDQCPPTFLLQPQIPKEINLVSGYHRSAEMIFQGASVAKPIIGLLKEKLCNDNRQPETKG